MDYLNPDSMLTPTNAKDSWYAPSYDQMLWAETRRGLQAEEMIKHQNEMNAYERIKEKHKLPAFMAEEELKLGDALSKDNPDYRAAMRSGEIGKANTEQATGAHDLATLQGKINTTNATNNLQQGNIAFMDDYQRKETTARTLQGIVSMYPPGPAREQKIANYLRMAANPKGGWLVQENMDQLQQYAKNPEKVLEVLKADLDSMLTQPNRFEWNMQDRRLKSAEKINANEQATRQAIGRSETKKEAQIVYEDFMATDPKFRELSPDARWRRVYEAMSYRTPASQPLETREGWVKITQPDGSVKWEKVTTKEPEKSVTSTPSPAAVKPTLPPGAKLVD